MPTQRTGLAFSSRQDSTDEELISVAQRAEALGYDTFFTGESWGRDAFHDPDDAGLPYRKAPPGNGDCHRVQPDASDDRPEHCVLGPDLERAGNPRTGHERADSHRGLARRRIQAPAATDPGVYRDHPSRPWPAPGSTTMARSSNWPVSAWRPRRYRRRSRVFLASLGPRNLALTGQLADGWLPVWTHRGHLPEMKGAVGESAEQAGRSINQITVAPQILCYVTDDPEELARAEANVRGHMAYYVGGMGTYYFKPVLPIWIRTRGRGHQGSMGGRRQGQGSLTRDG